MSQKVEKSYIALLSSSLASSRPPDRVSLTPVETHHPYKNNIRDVGSTADLVLVLLVHLVHWYLVHGLIGTSGALVPGTLVPTVT